MKDNPRFQKALELQGQDITDDIKVVCEADDRLWLVFTRDMTRKQWRSFKKGYEKPSEVEMLETARENIGTVELPEDDAAKSERLLAEHADRMTAELARIITAHSEAAAEQLFDSLKAVIIDGEFVCAGETYSGIDEIITAAEAEDLTFVAEGFLISAIDEAMQKATSLGNARRRN